MTCCGGDRTTPFCPECGKHLGMKADVAQYMRAQLGKAETRLADLSGAVAKQEDPRDCLLKCVERTKSRVAKWQSRLDWVLRQGE